MNYSVDELLAEAAASDLTIEFFEQRYWRECHELQWCCWVRSRANPQMAKKGEGRTAGEAINEALNKALTFDPLPEVKITTGKLSLETRSLDRILKDMPVTHLNHRKPRNFDRRGL